MKFTIITPTIGNVYLGKLLESINSLICNNLYSIEHLIVIDGSQFESNAMNILNSVKCSDHITRLIMCLPFNTGNGGYHGHKIYAGVSQLINADYIIFLDEDNFLEPNHLEQYYNILNKNKLDWCFCLRNIVEPNGEFVCKDMCESLGHIHNVFYNSDVHLIDTSCYCISNKVLTKTSHVWNRIGLNDGNDPDRIFCNELMTNYKNFACTYDYTLNYRTSSRKKSVNKNLFLTGNDTIKKMYGMIPWENKNGELYVISITYYENHTKELLNKIYLGNEIKVDGINDVQNLSFLNYYSKYKPLNHKILKVSI